MASTSLTQPRDSGLSKGMPMVGTVIVALIIACESDSLTDIPSVTHTHSYLVVAFVLLAIFVYGVKKICPCPFIPMGVAVPRQNGRSGSDLHLMRGGHEMRQLSNTSFDSIALATTAPLRLPPPAYHVPYANPPEYQYRFAVAGNLERGAM